MVARPHGGRLVNRVATGRRRERLKEEVKDLQKLKVNDMAAYDVENIAYGVYSPLEGFMVKEELEWVLSEMRLPNDLPWTMPIVLWVNSREQAIPEEGDLVALLHGSGLPLAVLHVEEVYTFDKRVYAGKVFKTRDPRHPGVARILSAGDVLVGGKVELINDPPNPYERYTLRPVETRVLFRERGWRTVAGFQTRNAPHLGHEYIQKTALAFVDGVFINPVIGRKKKGDFKDEVILAAYETLIRHYHRKDSVVMSILRYEMRYAGPREAVHHAIMRKNFGCTHFIVGRDHAGVGNYYGPYEAQEIFKEFPDLGITPLFFREFFYCKRCKGVVNEKICPHSESDRVRFSGTKIRKLLTQGEKPPLEMMRPEVVETILSFEKPFVE